MNGTPHNQATEVVRRRYDRISRHYDLMEWAAERRVFRGWRQQVWSLVTGRQVLEVGVGTGKNIPFYPADAQVTAVDLSPGMLGRARELAERTGTRVDLREMDVEHLAFADDSFDHVVTTFVFCSVPDPVKGFVETGRVLRPDGRGIFLEHVLSHTPVIRQGMNALNPLVRTIMGANINRQTRDNIEAAGLIVESETDLWRDIVKLFVVRSR